MPSETFGRAANASRSTVEDVGVDHGGSHVVVPQQSLYRSDVPAKTGHHSVYANAVSAARPAVPTGKTRVRDSLYDRAQSCDTARQQPPHGLGVTVPGCRRIAHGHLGSTIEPP